MKTAQQRRTRRAREFGNHTFRRLNQKVPCSESLFDKHALRMAFFLLAHDLDIDIGRFCSAFILRSAGKPIVMPFKSGSGKTSITAEVEQNILSIDWWILKELIGI